MDRRSWLWRRKSSEKSPGETDSSGGSMSSHSERFSDDQIYSNQSSQSPEVTSKTEEEVEGALKTLSQKLSEALLTITIKEDLVKQHSKVAEEAVEGWEKAEMEVLALRQQNQVISLQNSSLEDRVSHLDGALKECLRQLRQTREESEQKVEEAIRNKTSELERENSGLKLEIASMAEELELRFIERELSNQAAEEASKLHLESVKKAAKFEAECAALRKAAAQKPFAAESDEARAMEINLMDDFLEMEKLVALPPSRTSEVLEMEKHILERERENDLKASTNVAKLEVAKLEALLNDARERVKRSEREVLELRCQLDIERREAESRLKDSHTKRQEAESRLTTELQSLILKVDSLETEVGNERDLSGKWRAKYQELETELESMTLKVDSLETELRKERDLANKLGYRCHESETELESMTLKVDSLEMEVRKERDVSNKLGAKCQELETELKSMTLKVDPLEMEVRKERDLSDKLRAKCQELETELKSMTLKADSLETEVQKEHDLSGKLGSRCRELEHQLESLISQVDILNTESKKMDDRSRELENEISRLQRENQYPKPAILNQQLSMKQDNELALAGSKFADCQKTISSLSRQLKTLATLEDLLMDTNEFSRRMEK